jgi:hypothetical protein
LISGCIINNDKVKVRIILHDDGLDIANVALLGFIIERWDDDAKGTLLVLAYIILFIVIDLLSLGKLFRDCGAVIEHILEYFGLRNLFL